MSPETVEPFDGIPTVVLRRAAPAVAVPSNSMGTSSAAHSARTAKALRAVGNRSIDGGRKRMGMLFPRSSREHAKATVGNPPRNGRSDA